MPIRTLVSEALIALLIGSCIPLSGGCGIEGLHAAKPETRVDFDPISHTFKFRDSKDNDLSVKGFEANTASGSKGKFDELTIRNNASDVRNANVNQLLGMAAEATANWNGAVAETKALGEVLGIVMPFVPQTIAASVLGKLKGGSSLTGPGGIGVQQAGNAQLAEYLMQIAGTALPTTRPQ